MIQKNDNVNTLINDIKIENDNSTPKTSIDEISFGANVTKLENNQNTSENIYKDNNKISLNESFKNIEEQKKNNLAFGF